VEDKMDGSQFSLVVDEGSVLAYPRGRERLRSPEPPSYSGLLRWILENRDRLLRLGEGIALYGEWLRVRRVVPYDSLPDWAIFFDAYDLAEGRFLGYEEKVELIEGLGLSAPPLLARLELECRGKREVKVIIERLADIAEGRSAFSSTARSMEGIVVKNYEREMFAKLVNPWYEVELEEIIPSRGLEFNELGATRQKSGM